DPWLPRRRGSRSPPSCRGLCHRRCLRGGRVEGQLDLREIARGLAPPDRDRWAEDEGYAAERPRHLEAIPGAETMWRGRRDPDRDHWQAGRARELHDAFLRLVARAAGP